ncbi:YraN family protein [Colwellia sp. Arc7-D]|uniref:YraN family protein n=1 Tax=Colwellia sp. Arc7-D TaxID=2161872 RepID=UPI000D33A417|nr:YraN family protein [Colwellia sp. Arc7-D]AWB56627.1 YraN family protein [Colwellia sp. Arc7-D]MBA6415154.1 YraN family protein [Colwellia sp. 6M3]
MLWTNKANTVTTGKNSEQLAAHYLAQQGLLLKTCNFQNRRGEIDLIMIENDVFVFVEVKYRKNSHFGGAIAAVSIKKQQKIKQCAAFYLQQAGLNEYNTPCRFDVIAMQGNINNPDITWLKNAF